jgi:hypothetical protein
MELESTAPTATATCTECGWTYATIAYPRRPALAMQDAAAAARTHRYAARVAS